MRLSGRAFVALAALLGIVIVWSTNEILPATNAYQAQMRVWLVARAAGFTAYLILTFVVAIGLVLSHPVNKSTWKLSKRLFPWHENLFVFTLAFVLAHVASLVVDPYAGVGLAGAFVPGLSSFRNVPVALGTLGLYSLLITALTARYTKVLPAGMWLRIHRFSIVVWALSWGHGILAGTDSGAVGWLYVGTGLLIVAATAYRYWVARVGRPTFATSLPAGSGHAPGGHAPGGDHAGRPPSVGAPTAADGRSS